MERRQEIAGDCSDVVVQERVLREDRLRLRRAVLQNELLDVLRPVLHEGLVATFAVLQKNAERVFLLLLQVAQQLLQPRNARSLVPASSAPGSFFSRDASMARRSWS